MLTSVPNILTLSRIGAIPLLVALFFVRADWAQWCACVVFASAAVTDYLDGYLARSMSQVSVIGKFLDPIADKLLVSSVLFLLVAFGRLSGIDILPAIVILLREVLVSGLREFLAGANIRLPVSRLAKWKTAVQMVALGVLIVNDAGPSGLGLAKLGGAGLWMAAVLTVITGWDYMRVGLRHMTVPPAPLTAAPVRERAQPRTPKRVGTVL